MQQVTPNSVSTPVIGVRVTESAAVDRPGRLALAVEGSTVVVTNPGGPGVIAEPSGSGLAACTTASDLSRVTCPASGVVAIQAKLLASPNVVDASAAPELRLFADGAGGNDRITISDSSAVSNFVTGGAGNDTLNGGPRQDILIGDESSRAETGNDILNGNGGPDILDGGPGSDVVDGGPDNDSYSYANQAGPATVTLGDDLCNDGTPTDTAQPGTVARSGCSANGVDRDLLLSIENLTGTQQSDDLTGGPVAERFAALRGADDVEGGLGVDTMLGGGDADVLTSRDGVLDAATQCGSVPTDRTAGDRAIADPDDDVDPSCVTVERGAFGTPGPVGTPPSTDPTAPPEFQPAPTEKITPGVPSNGSEGTGPGGGNGGLTPPELEITSPVATVSKRGVAELRVRCVYLAQACVGEIELKASKAAKAGKGRKKVTIKKGTALGSQSVDIPWGTSEPILVKVSKPVRNLFRAGADKLQVKTTVTARDGAAGAAAAEARVTAKVTLGASGR